MGRPAKEDKERRSINFTIRLTEEELRRLVLLSTQAGRPPAVLIRDKVFKGRFPEPRTARLDREAYLELKRIGVNLNQLTRKVNAGQLPPDLLSVLETLERHEAAIVQQLLGI